MGFLSNIGNIVDRVGTRLRLPERGISERIAGGPTVNTPTPIQSFFGINGNVWTRYSDGSTVDTGEKAYNPDVVDTSDIPSTPPIYTAPAPTGGGSTDIAGEQAYYQDQIDNLNRLIQSSESKLGTGLSNIGSSFDFQNRNLADQRIKTMGRYGDQTTQNIQEKQRGIEGVDSFANQSYRSLMRLLAGAGAGNSSVARTLMPSLVSKAGATRRAGVFDTAGRNQRDIDMAIGDATDQFNMSQQELDNWRTGQEKDLRTGIETEGFSRAQNINQLEIQKNMASGMGYEAARDAASDTRDDVNRRMGNLDRLFGNYNPTYAARPMNLKTPELGQYTIDKATIDASNTPGNEGYYGSMLRKRKELQF